VQSESNGFVEITATSKERGMHIHGITQKRPAKAELYTDILTKIQLTAETFTAVRDAIDAVTTKQ